MTRFILVSIILLSITLACVAPSYVVTPTTSPTATPAPTRRSTATAETVKKIAVVRQPVVTVRDAADGVPTGEYIRAGDEVTIIEIDGDWVHIEDPDGWVFAGCLVGISQKGCIAK